MLCQPSRLKTWISLFFKNTEDENIQKTVEQAETQLFEEQDENQTDGQNELGSCTPTLHQVFHCFIIESQKVPYSRSEITNLNTSCCKTLREQTNYFFQANYNDVHTGNQSRDLVFVSLTLDLIDSKDDAFSRPVTRGTRAFRANKGAYHNRKPCLK